MRRAPWRFRASDPFTQYVTAAAVLFALLATQFVLLMVGSVVSGKESRRATEDTFAFLANLADERVSRYVDGAHHATNGVQASIESAEASELGLVKALYLEMRAVPEVNFISVTFPTGEYASLERVNAPFGGYTAVTSRWDATAGFEYYVTRYDGQLTLATSEEESFSLNPTSANSYSEAAAGRSAVWTYGTSIQQPGVRVPMYSIPVRAEDHSLLAVVSARIDLAALSRSINELPRGTTADVLLLTASREPIAGPPRALASVRAREAAEASPEAADEVFREEFQAQVATTGVADPTSGDMVFGRAGSDLTVEKGLPLLGVDWIVHIRADETSVNEGFARLRMVVTVVLAALTLVTVGLALVMWRLRKPVRAMRDIATRDPLTGLLNRQTVRVRAARLVNAASRQGGTVAVVMLDLDNFKGLNDDLGHAAGDEALSEIGRVLLGELRANDMAVRWGGDEFLLVLTFGPRDDPASSVERIRARMERSLVRQFGPGRGLGVTAGFALAAPVLGPVDIAALIDDADVALVDGKWRAKGATYGAGMAGAVT